MTNDDTKELPAGRSLPYWKTGRAAAEDWVRRACAEIERAGGSIELCLPSAFQAGRAGRRVPAPHRPRGDAIRHGRRLCPLAPP